MALSAGDRIGPYEILGLVGAGGMGEVYRARDTRLDRIVAIKMLARDLADRPEFGERLEREARVVSSLAHPNICALFDMGEHHGAAFLVMEYLEGETLEARLRRAPMPIDQALKIAVAIAGSLAAAHRAGVTHRDLKPANIVLTRSGPKLLDFGLAKARSSPVEFGHTAATQAALTAQGTIVGTLQYMAPEQVEGADVDARADVFAFGATLYEMVTGRKAFNGKSQASVLAAVLGAKPAPMSSLQAMTPPALEHLVERCLAKEREERWQSMADIAHELEWLLDTRSDGAPSVAAAAPRGWRAWLLVAVSVASLVIAAAVSLVHLREPAAPPPPVLRYTIPLPKVGAAEGLYFQFHLSPDGAM